MSGLVPRFRLLVHRPHRRHQEPLFIVDGVALSSGVGSKLADIDPADVKRIDVLKDASETAIYGAHGANGVIVITLNHRK